MKKQKRIQFNMLINSINNYKKLLIDRENVSKKNRFLFDERIEIEREDFFAIQRNLLVDKETSEKTKKLEGKISDLLEKLEEKKETKKFGKKGWNNF